MRHKTGGMRLDRGYSLIEAGIVTAFIAIAIVLLLPSLLGYQATAQVRSYTALAVAQIRQAELMAQTQDQPLSICVSNAGLSPCIPPNLQAVGEHNGWMVVTGVNVLGSVQIATWVPAPLNVSGCSQTTVAPNGTVTSVGSCTYPFLICIDSGGPYAYQEQVRISPATGQLTVVQGSGQCRLEDDDD